MPIIDNKIYLASKSPRRRELLRQVGIDFDLLLLRDTAPRGPDVTEIVLPGELPMDYVKRVTQEKAQVAWSIMQQRKLAPRPVLAADTTVVIHDHILGKPADQAEACDMLRALSGQTHAVLTSLAVVGMHGHGHEHWQEHWHITQRSEVTFSELSEEQILAYCITAEPYDKAGGYGIQGAAARFISHISGSYSGIMGLPLFETATLLRQAGIHIP
ncbi:Maf family protein [Undibacterium sp. RTI2.1]|uniref:Maf family protein n=1 Tax=unclassified Undibacterium TaxID=2630295 RepID=UPI002B232078|nr:MULTISPECIES: Maf family protein [unclassified Undibacterium]MEB0032413.1 Maf family protein [Undibacterium sp. RTI2.1]MEB0118612.1 Maf family protein [Undibacterium sp. RTI2.2]